ncbi:hypothetical protein [Pendulispora albinea]|uniref:Uncharacterized protein n=1 Tax=Pendulispora albinea TaxID=2741071 RepID=A0ABZ2M3Y5_9BACT
MALVLSFSGALVACVDNGKPADQPQGYNLQDNYPPAPESAPAASGPAAPRQMAQAQKLQVGVQPAPSAAPPQGFAMQAAPAPESAPANAPAPAPGSAPSPLPGIPLDPALMAQVGSASLAVLTPGGVAGDPIEGGIKTAATRFAPNMQPEGQMAKDSLRENEHKTMLVTLTGGKCYTIIGFSPAGQVRNLDLRLLSPPFYNVQAGQDDTVDGTPIVGKSSAATCPITPFPLQYKLDIHAQKGGGQFGVQVFSRMK